MRKGVGRVGNNFPLSSFDSNPADSRVCAARDVASYVSTAGFPEPYWGFFLNKPITLSTVFCWLA
jgi:hypothetical protein